MRYVLCILNLEYEGVLVVGVCTSSLVWRKNKWIKIRKWRQILVSYYFLFLFCLGDKVLYKSALPTFITVRFLINVACSQTLYFLFKVRRARLMKKKKRGGFIDRQCKGVGVGEEENRYFSFLRPALALRACSPHSRARRCFPKERKRK